MGILDVPAKVGSGGNMICMILFLWLWMNRVWETRGPYFFLGIEFVFAFLLFDGYWEITGFWRFREFVPAKVGSGGNMSSMNVVLRGNSSKVRETRGPYFYLRNGIDCIPLFWWSSLVSYVIFT